MHHHNADFEIETSGATTVPPKAAWVPAPSRPGTPDSPQMPKPIEKPAAIDPLKVQVGGSHYKKLAEYQPWQVLQHWLSEEEFRGYMKGTAISYLCRESDKGGSVDIEKAIHTLQGLLALDG